MRDAASLRERFLDNAHYGNGTGCRCCDLVYDGHLAALLEVADAADELMRLDRGLESVAALPPGKVSMHVQVESHTHLHEALRRLTEDA